MELTSTHLSLFVATFLGMSAFMMLVMIARAVRWVQNKPRNEAVMLGDDMRGRVARVEEFDPVQQHFFVTLGAERWRVDCDPKFKEHMEIGGEVRVHRINGLVLEVRPVK